MCTRLSWEVDGNAESASEAPLFCISHELPPGEGIGRQGPWSSGLRTPTPQGPPPHLMSLLHRGLQAEAFQIWWVVSLPRVRAHSGRIRPPACRVRGPQVSRVPGFPGAQVRAKLMWSESTQGAPEAWLGPGTFPSSPRGPQLPSLPHPRAGLPATKLL